MIREQRRLAAIVAADVAGYSRLMGRDECGTLAVLKALALCVALMIVKCSLKGCASRDFPNERVAPFGVMSTLSTRSGSISALG
jgi:hypothetical protein